MSFVLRLLQDCISTVRHPQFVFFGLQVPAPLTSQCTTPIMDSKHISVTGKNEVNRVTLEPNKCLQNKIIYFFLK